MHMSTCEKHSERKMIKNFNHKLEMDVVWYYPAIDLKESLPYYSTCANTQQSRKLPYLLCTVHVWTTFCIVNYCIQYSVLEYSMTGFCGCTAFVHEKFSLIPFKMKQEVQTMGPFINCIVFFYFIEKIRNTCEYRYQDKI